MASRGKAVAASSITELRERVETAAALLADVTLESAAEFGGSRVIAVVLTGMGNDGAQGVQVVKKNQGRVIAQDESTSVVFGMPAEAIRTGAVDRVLATDEIYAVIEKYVERIMSAAPPLGVR